MDIASLIKIVIYFHHTEDRNRQLGGKIAFYREMLN